MEQLEERGPYVPLRVKAPRSSIVAAYLERHGLIAPPDPREEDERRRREFKERGWVEHNPPPTPESNSGDGD
jgi:hypothetical protein